MEPEKRIDILGCPFDVVSFSETVDKIKEALTNKNVLKISTANVDFVMKAMRDPGFTKTLLESELVVADGVPILWAAELLGSPLRGRVNGTDLVMKCAEISAQTGCNVALIGAMPGVSNRAVKKMKEIWPEAKLHAIPTPYPLGNKENTILLATINHVNAKIVLVALGSPFQERWINSYLRKCGANVGIGIGSAFDILCGDKSRAPRWMRNNGLEWLYRLIQEPKRLSKRYLIEDSPFFIYLFIKWVKFNIYRTKVYINKYILLI